MGEGELSACRRRRRRRRRQLAPDRTWKSERESAGGAAAQWVWVLVSRRPARPTWGGAMNRFAFGSGSRRITQTYPPWSGKGYRLGLGLGFGFG